MKIKYLPGLFLAIAVNLVANAQVVYHLQYKFNDSTQYRAFFVRYNDGSGLVRITFTEPQSKQPVVAELSVQERRDDKRSGTPNTGKFYYDTAEFKFISQNKTAFPVPVFIFSVNPATKMLEPLAVANRDNMGKLQPGTLQVKELKTTTDLNKDFVSQFFFPGDDFYEFLFGITQRGFTDDDRKGARLILRIVANTNDPEIGSSCKFDRERMLEMCSDIKDFLGIPWDTATIFGKNYTKANVQKMIRDLTPRENDIVIFYYSGHGFRKPKQPADKIFPFLDLRPKPDQTYMVNSLNIEDIYDSIRLKPHSARLNLVLSDCCNSIPTAKNPHGPVPLDNRGNMDQSEDNFKSLFLDRNPISILMTAADVEQRSSNNNDFGGFFSYCFKTALEKYLSPLKNKVNWDQVVAEAKKQTPLFAEGAYCDSPNICRQFPIPKIKYGRGGQ